MHQLEVYDDVAGAALDPREVMKARQVDIKFFRDRRVYTNIFAE